MVSDIVASTKPCASTFPLLQFAAALTVSLSLQAAGFAENISIFAADQIGFGAGQQREISRSVTFPVFGPSDRLTFDWDILGDQDPWDRSGSMHAILPSGQQVQLGKFVTGFNGTTSHSRDVSQLASMLSGQTLTIEAHIDTWVENAWRVNASLSVEAGANPAPNPNWFLPVISRDAGWGWSESGNLSETYNFTAPSNLSDVTLTYFASGHHHTQTSNSDEFNQRRHRLFVDGQEVWSAIPWRTDGPLFRDVNPTSAKWDGNGDGDTNDPYPIDQWSSDFPRSGWVPGDEIDPYVIDVTPFLTGSANHDVTLLIEDVDINSYWRVSAYVSGTIGTAPNGIAGDINQDGFVNGDGLGDVSSDDVAAFIANFATSESYLTPYEKITHGDLDLDGDTDILDWYILYSNHENASNLNLQGLLAGQQVPEPPTVVLLVALVTVLGGRRAASIDTDSKAWIGK